VSHLKANMRRIRFLASVRLSVLSFVSQMELWQ